MVTLPIFKAFNLVYVREQSTGRITGDDIAIHLGNEVILVTLTIMQAGLGVTAAHSCKVFAILAFWLAPHGEGYTCSRHQVPDIGRIDEHFSVEGFTAQGGNGNDTLAVHFYSIFTV